MTVFIAILFAVALVAGYYVAGRMATTERASRTDVLGTLHRGWDAVGSYAGIDRTAAAMAPARH